MQKNTISRRQFLKIAGVGLATTTLAQTFDLSPAQAQALEARRQSGTLRTAWGHAPSTLDPLFASSDNEIAFLNAVYDYLIDTDSQSNLIPRLATDWLMSEDGLQYTLQIAEDVKFHDGSDLTLDDIIWTFDRLRDPESGSPTADLFSNIVSIEPGEEENTLVFTLDHTEPDFLYNLTDNHAVILKAGAENIGNEFNGTGPFQLVEYIAEDRSVFTANPDYFGGAPGVETLEFIYFGDTEAAINALKGGVVDVVLRMDNPSFLSLSSDEMFNAIDVPTNGHDLVRLRADREPGSDERVRQAFKLATDRQAIFDRIQLGFGALGNDTPIGPLYGAYYTEEYMVPERDPEAAKELLAEAGYPDGLEMTLYVPNSGDRPALAQVLAAQWEEADIKITIEIQDESIYYAEDGWLEVDLGITGWGSRPVPQIYLDVAYKSGAKWNEAHFSDEELDKWIEIAGTSIDQEKRVEAYHEIQRILVERGPVIIPYFFAQFGVMAKYVENVSVHPFAGRTNFHAALV